MRSDGNPGRDFWFRCGSNESSPRLSRWNQNGQNSQEWLFISAKYQIGLTTNRDS
jgi:hypothetical protein